MVKHPPSKHNALSSNASTTQKSNLINFIREWGISTPAIPSTLFYPPCAGQYARAQKMR
jgi:hypothetical protein